MRNTHGLYASLIVFLLLAVSPRTHASLDLSNREDNPILTEAMEADPYTCRRFGIDRSEADPARAVELYERFVRENPDSVEAPLALAQAGFLYSYTRIRDDELAASYFERALESAGDMVTADLFLARTNLASLAPDSASRRAALLDAYEWMSSLTEEQIADSYTRLLENAKAEVHHEDGSVTYELIKDNPMYANDLGALVATRTGAFFRLVDGGYDARRQNIIDSVLTEPNPFAILEEIAARFPDDPLGEMAQAKLRELRGEGPTVPEAMAIMASGVEPSDQESEPVEPAPLEAAADDAPVDVVATDAPVETPAPAPSPAPNPEPANLPRIAWLGAWLGWIVALALAVCVALLWIKARRGRTT